MSYNTKNYSENGGKLVIGGTLEVLNGAKLSGFPVAENQGLSAVTTIAKTTYVFSHSIKK